MIWLLLAKWIEGTASNIRGSSKYVKDDCVFDSHSIGRERQMQGLKSNFRGNLCRRSYVIDRKVGCRFGQDCSRSIVA